MLFVLFLCAGDKAGIQKPTNVKPTRALKDLLPQTARIACANLAPQPVVTVDASTDSKNKPSSFVWQARSVVVVAVVLRRRTGS